MIMKMGEGLLLQKKSELEQFVIFHAKLRACKKDPPSSALHASVYSAVISCAAADVQLE